MYTKILLAQYYQKVNYCGNFFFNNTIVSFSEIFLGNSLEFFYQSVCLKNLWKVVRLIDRTVVMMSSFDNDADGRPHAIDLIVDL